MRHSASVAWSLLLLGPLTSGCGGSTPAPEAPTKSDAATEKAPPPAAAPAVALTPVSAPRSTFLWGRLKNPAGLADSVIAATALPLNWRGQIERESPELVRIISLDAPVELAMTLDENPRREPHGVVSFGVGSEGAVLAELERQGIAVRTVSGGERWFTLEDASCALGSSLGATPARVVCSDDDESLGALLPYALRGLPNEPLSDAEVHVELRAEPLKTAYRSEIRSLKLLASLAARQIELDSARFDRAATDAIMSLAEEGILLADDLDRVTLQLFAREQGDYELAFSTKFSQSRSWTAGSVGVLAQKQSAPPDVFWKLPADSSGASFGHTLPAERTRAIQENLVDLLGGLLEHEKIGAKTRVRIEALVRDMMSYEGPVVSATGPVRPVKASEAALEPAWQLVGIEGDAARYRKQLEELSRLLSSPELRKAAGSDAEWIPELTPRGALKGRPGSILYEWKVAGDTAEIFDPGTLRSDSLLGAAQRFSHGYLALVPDGSRVWFSFASDRALVSEPIDVLFQTASPRLDGVAGLTTLREMPSTASGFVKLEGLVGPFLGELSERPNESWQGISRALPYAGKVPLTYQLRMQGGAAPSFELVERVPHEFVADVTSLILQLAADD